ncbi:MAG: hypothetical protein ACPG47_00085 [Leucothrix sp.]
MNLSFDSIQDLFAGFKNIANSFGHDVKVVSDTTGNPAVNIEPKAEEKEEKTSEKKA